MSTPNMDALIRQKQIMDQLGQITSQGTQSAMIQPGIGQFQTSGDQPTVGDQQIYHPQHGGILGLGGAASMKSRIPGVSKAREAVQGLQDKISNAVNPPPKNPNLTPAPINNVPQQPYTPQPTLKRRDETMGGSTGFKLQIGPDGNIQAVPNG